MNRPPIAERKAIASLAHAKAHEVQALREAQQRVRELPAQSPDDIHQLLDAMVLQRQQQIALMGNEVIGHA